MNSNAADYMTSNSLSDATLYANKNENYENDILARHKKPDLISFAWITRRFNTIIYPIAYDRSMTKNE